jgi:hypothetical protein
MKAKSSGYFTFVKKDFLWFCGSVGILFYPIKLFHKKTENKKQKTKQ